MNKEQHKEGRTICPYNPSHDILNHRFNTHLVRCRRNHADAPKSTCPFNTSHIVNVQELSYHMQNCPNRNQLDDFFNTNVEQKIKVTLESDWGNENEENWDTNAPCYDPQENIENKELVRRKDIASNAEKRVWHESERQRFQRLENQRLAALGECSSSDGPSTSRARTVNHSQQEIPEVVAIQLQNLHVASGSFPSQQRRSLSEISFNARVPGEQQQPSTSNADDEWQKVPVRGRGRGGNKNKKMG